MAKFELIYEKDCPHVSQARIAMLSSLKEMNLPLSWIEWDRSADDIPGYVSKFGSPTILIDGVDILGLKPESQNGSCRIYSEDGILSGAPTQALISKAILLSNKNPSIWKFIKQTLGPTPAFAAALLPKLTCAACFPAYGSLLAFFGIGLWNYTPYLLPITLASFVFLLFTLFFRAQQRRGYIPFYLGLAAAMIFISARFILGSDTISYFGIAGLLIASIWNAWPMHNQGARESFCASCESKNLSSDLKL